MLPSLLRAILRGHIKAKSADLDPPPSEQERTALLDFVEVAAEKDILSILESAANDAVLFWKHKEKLTLPGAPEQGAIDALAESMMEEALEAAHDQGYAPVQQPPESVLQVNQDGSHINDDWTTKLGGAGKQKLLDAIFGKGGQHEPKTLKIGHKIGNLPTGIGKKILISDLESHPYLAKNKPPTSAGQVYAHAEKLFPDPDKVPTGQAHAEAVLGADGVLIGITIIHGGKDYKTPPSLTLDHSKVKIPTNAKIEAKFSAYQKKLGGD